MKSASAAMQTHIAGALTTLTTCLKLTRTDGEVFAFTALDQEFTFESVLHKIGYDPTAVVSTDQMSVDNVEWAGVVDHEDILSEDVRAGKYDGATYEIYRVNWADLTQGKIILKTGTIGNINLETPDSFVAEGRSLAQALQVKVGMHFTPHCKWDLGDSRCKVVFAGAFAPVAGTVATVADVHWQFTGTGAFVPDTTIPVPAWQPSHTYFVGDSVLPLTATTPDALRAVVANLIWDEKKHTQDVPSGKSGNDEPEWPNEEGEHVEDNELEWVMVKDRYYKDGVLVFTSGPNAGLAKQFEVLDFTKGTNTFRLALPTPFPITAGDTFTVEPGCDKTHMTCIYKFNNILNFGGEPYVAGLNRPSDTPTDEDLES